LAAPEADVNKIDSNPPGTVDIVMGVSLNANNNTIYGVKTPTGSDWVATKAYVDGTAEVYIGATQPSDPNNYDLWYQP
jgi:hypothetical protein